MRWPNNSFSQHIRWKVSWAINMLTCQHRRSVWWNTLVFLRRWVGSEAILQLNQSLPFEIWQLYPDLAPTGRFFNRFLCLIFQDIDALSPALLCLQVFAYCTFQPLRLLERSIKTLKQTWSSRVINRLSQTAVFQHSLGLLHAQLFLFLPLQKYLQKRVTS